MFCGPEVYRVEHLICNEEVGGSSPPRSTHSLVDLSYTRYPKVDDLDRSNEDQVPFGTWGYLNNLIVNTK